MMCSVDSEGIVGFYSYPFRINNAGNWYESGKFKIKGMNDCNFRIQLFGEKYTNEYQVFGEKYTEKYQVLVYKDNKKSELAKITVSILGEEITRIVRNWTDSCYFIKEGSSSLPANIKVDCQIIWYGTTENSIPVRFSLSPFSGFHNFDSNSSLSDLQISIGGEELSAHKVILAAHSPVFLSMFETNMKEKMESRIVIEGIELDVMKIVLSILYTGYDGDLDELGKAENVLVVAERYDMKALKRLCEWKIFQKLDVSNVLDVLDKADNYNAEILRAGCINFIIQNKKRMADSADLIKTICRNKPDMISELLLTLMIT